MTAPPAPSPEQLAAYRAGRDAFLAGGTGLDCPYPAPDPDRVDEQGLRALWIRGFVQTRSKVGQAPPQLPADPELAGAPEQ